MKKNVLVLVLLSVITLGIYIPIWFIKQKKYLEGLKSRNTFDNTPPTLALIVAIVPMILVPGTVLYGLPTEELLDKIISFSNLAFIIIILKLSFITRRILIDHYSKEIQVSRILTFFFWIYYLQYKINRLES